MNKTATNIVEDSLEKVAKLGGNTTSKAIDLYRHTAKKGGKINTGKLKALATVGGLGAGAYLADKAIQKHDNKKLKTDTKIRFLRDGLVPGTKRTAKQLAIGALPAAATVLAVTNLKHRPKGAGHIYENLSKAQAHMQGHNIISPEKARDLLKKSVVAGGAAYTGSKYYLRDKALRDRAKITGEEITVKDRILNASVPVARKFLPAELKANGAGIFLQGITPESQIQAKRQNRIKREKLEKELNKEATVIINESFEKIAKLSEDEQKEFNSLRSDIVKKNNEIVKGNAKEAPKHLLSQYGGTASAVAGGNLVNSARREGQLDGIVRRYHNTKAENVKGIKNQGIKASRALDPDAITRIVGLSEDEMKGKTYLAKNRTVARGVGARRQQIADMTNPWILPNEADSFKKSFKTQKTMKVNIPLSEYKKLNFVANPELKGAKSAKEFMHKSNLDPLTSAQAYKNLGKNTDVIGGDIASKFIKGGKDYKKQTLKGIARNIKENPKDFAKGVGKAGLGTAMLAGGTYLAGKSLKETYTRNKKQKEEMKNDPNRARFNELLKKSYNR